jgi:hypothetical protein
MNTEALLRETNEALRRYHSRKDRGRVLYTYIDEAGPITFAEMQAVMKEYSWQRPQRLPRQPGSSKRIP